MSAVHISRNKFRNEVMDPDKSDLPDVRPSEEYRGGHIPGSRNASLQTVDKAASVAENKDTTLAVRCSGARSRQAAGLLQRPGDTDGNKIGGIAAYAGKEEV